MTTTPTQAVLRHIRGMVAAEQAGHLPDGELLQRFATCHEESAFAALVRRHGPLVLGVCRRVLHDRHDAEDAFQAAFLALARHAGTVGRRGSVGGWLHRVAYHAAVKVRTRTARRQEYELRAESPPSADPLAEVSGRELMALLDEEVQRLPDEYREPLVLCYLEGKTRDQASRECGCSLGTTKRRLDRARQLLRTRLAARGVALPAALLTAALVPDAGSAAVPAKLAGDVIRAALLAPEALSFAAVGKFKTALALLLAVGAMAVGVGVCVAPRAALPAGACEPVVQAAEPPTRTGPPPAPPVPLSPDETKEMLASGRVVGPDGKPVPGAQVAVIAWQGLYLSSFEDPAWSRTAVLGCVRSGADGKFRLTVPRLPRLSGRKVRLLAATDGLGLAWKRLDPKAESVDAEMRLPPEQIVRGRLVDLQGEPVGGARVLLTGLTHKPAKGEEDEGHWRLPQEGLPFGPATATVSAQGEFTIRGLGTNLTVELEVHDDRVELHSFAIDTADKKQAENVKLALPPGRIVEGVVTYEDSGKPVPHTRVTIVTAGGGEVSGTTDKEGRYHLNVRPPGKRFSEAGKELGIHAFPPAGTPYWMAMQGINWVKGATRHETNVALPRGVLVRGRITEAGSGDPLAGVYLEYNGQWMHKAVSAADGSYAFGVPAEATGSLTVTAPTPDYVPQVIGSAAVLGGLKGGDRVYYHAVVPLDQKPGEKEKEVPVVLRRGVTLKGRVLRPDGKPVKDTLLFVGDYLPAYEKVLHPILVRDGKFELPGCDPEKTYRLIFIEHPWVELTFGAEALHTYGYLWLRQLLGEHNKLGVTVEVSAKKAAAEPVEVRLLPCGSAKLRFVDRDGKPLAKHKPWVQLLVTPGPPSRQAIKEGTLSAEVVTLISQYSDDAEPHAGPDGVLTLEGLIPGATYRIKRAQLEGEVIQEFTAEAGKTVELTVRVQ
jgi:RNA polymerase sigma factor (sigma-70 family)